MIIENIKSYAFQNNEKEDGWKWWQINYANSLKEEVFGANKRRNSCGCVYCDPDEGNIDYYTQICHFLNSQEKNMISENKRYHYCVSNYNGNARINVCKSGEFLFFLKADQFGFSAPKTENKPNPSKVFPHPFNIYYEQEKDKSAAIENIVKWVYVSRSIGGSFLWPEEEGMKQPPYNLERGGSKNPKKSSYINDRVDLTLLEIKHFYNIKDEIKEFDYDFKNFIDEYQKKIPGDILGDISLAKSPNLYEWLMHFDCFKTYIDYFKLNMFIFQNEVIDITGSGYLDEMNTKNKRDIKKDFWDKEFNNVLELLCKKISERTEIMDEIIQKWIQSP